MKTILQNYQPTNEQEQLTNNTDSHNPMNAHWVWEQMAGIWGEQWMREQGEKPSSNWIMELSSITNQHLERGVKRTVSERLKWTPSLPLFLSLCLDFDTTDAYNRMINRKPVLDDVEYYTRQEVGYQCKRVLDDTKARALYNKVFKLKLELKRKGKLPIRGQKLLSAESVATEVDKEISSRTGSKVEAKKHADRMVRIEAAKLKHKT